MNKVNSSNKENVDTKNDKKSKEFSQNYKVGHRKRMKQKLLSGNKADFSDLEILEMWLYLIYPRGDVKHIAYKILQRYKNLHNFMIESEQFNNEDKKYVMQKEFGESISFLSKLIMVTLKRSLITSVKSETVLSKWSDLCEYLKIHFGNLHIEQFSVLYLDHSFRLIDIVNFGIGTVDESTVYVREIIKTGLSKNAKNLVLCHNHLSGKVEPSDSDIETTNQIILAGRIVNLNIIDHMIVSGDKIFSFKAADMMN